MRALLIDEGHDRAALVGARALALDGWTVGCAAPVQSLASRSRACSAFHRVTPLSLDSERFCADVASAMSEGRYDVVFPTWEAAVSALSRVRETLPGCFPFPSDEVLERSFDKGGLAKLAQQSGITYPHTAPVSEQALAEWTYPAVVKPAGHAQALRSASVAKDAAQARALATEIAATGGSALLQERVEGTLVAVAFVADRQGELRSMSQQRAQHTWPQPVGVTARGISEPLDERLLGRVAELVRQLGWWGLAQLQFLRGADGVERLIDFNGRYYGSMALALRAGVNHPAAWARVALELPLPAMTQRDGVYYQWLTRDLRASAASTRPTREIMRSIALAPRAAHSLFSPSEPSLAPRFLAEQLGRAVKRRLHRLADA